MKAFRLSRVIHERADTVTMDAIAHETKSLDWMKYSQFVLLKGAPVIPLFHIKGTPYLEIQKGKTLTRTIVAPAHKCRLDDEGYIFFPVNDEYWCLSELIHVEARDNARESSK